MCSDTALLRSELPELFLGLPLSWNDALQAQIRSAEVRFTDCGSSWFFDFACGRDVPRVQTTLRVPISVDLCRRFVCLGDSVNRLAARNNAFWIAERPGHAPEFSAAADERYTGVLLHFENGIVRTLEVVDWKGLPIDAERLLSDIRSGQQIFRVEDETFAAELRAK